MIRDGPLDITGAGGGGGLKNFRCRNFFYGLLVCRKFFSGTQALHEFFFAYRYISFFFGNTSNIFVVCLFSNRSQKMSKCGIGEH